MVTVVVAIVVYIVVGAISAAIIASMGVASGVAGSTMAAETATVDMGEYGKVEINGDTATVTVDGQEVEVTVPQE